MFFHPLGPPFPKQHTHKKDGLLETGWGVLNVGTKPTASRGEDMVAVHAAGMLECHLTAERIYDMYQGMNVFFFGNTTHPPTKLMAFLAQQEEVVLLFLLISR